MPLPFVQAGVDVMSRPWYPLALTAPGQMDVSDTTVLQLKKCVIAPTGACNGMNSNAM